MPDGLSICWRGPFCKSPLEGVCEHVYVMFWEESQTEDERKNAGGSGVDKFVENTTECSEDGYLMGGGSSPAGEVSEVLAGGKVKRIRLEFE